VNVIDPRHPDLLLAHHPDHFVHAVDEAFDRIAKEAQRGVTVLAGEIEIEFEGLAVRVRL
jgi:hypothetical protein